jgi:hypothetical protein
MMRKFIAGGSLFMVMTVGLFAAGAAQKGADFSGTWVLDKAKSEGLSPRVQGADSVSWVIAQDAKQVSREEKVEGMQAGPGGRGGGMMGGGPLTVKLDGSETATELPRISGKSTSKMKWLDSGKILEVNSVINGNMQGNDFTATTTEHWELAEDGKVLKVHRKTESPRGTMESKMVFNKK